MHSLKSYQRVLVFLLGMILMTCLLSPWLYASWDLVLGPRIAPVWEQLFGYRPDWRVPFPRFFDRTFMIFGMVLFVTSWRWLVGARSLREAVAVIGLQKSPRNGWDLLTGFGLALFSVIVIAGAMVAMDIFHFFYQYGFGEGLARCFEALFAALSVGLLEEFFFRGIVFRGLLEDWKVPWSFAGASLFFAAIHFVHSPEQQFLEAIEPLAGLRNFVASFRLYMTPELILPSFIGLFLLGVVLCLAFYRTGALYLSIGLHAGWVFSIKSILVFGDYRRRELGWLFGKLRPSFLSGVVVWLAFMSVGFVVIGFTRDRHGLETQLRRRAEP
jgi:membrane protease YdiL (CAAX protease family)